MLTYFYAYCIVIIETINNLHIRGIKIMTYDEYSNKLTAIVANPDTAPIAIQEILKEIKADTDTITSLTADVSVKDEKIRSLQDTNTKLFLQITGNDTGNNADTWEDMDGDEALNAFIAEHTKGE